MQLHTETSGRFAIVLASVLWGTTGTAVSFTPEVSPLATGAFAMGMAALLLVLHAWQALRANWALLCQHWPVVCVGALAIVVYPLAFYSAMRLAGVAIGTLVSLAGAPLIAILIECLFGKKRITLAWLVSFLLGATGLVLLLQAKTNTTNLVSLQSGIALGALAALSYALYTITTSKLVGYGVRSQAAMAIQFGLAATVLLPSLWFTADTLFSSPTYTAIALYTALIPMFLGYLCFGYGLRYVGASQATLITLLEPAVAALLAVLIVGERFNYTGWLGIAFIMLCLLSQLYVKTPLKPAVVPRLTRH